MQDLKILVTQKTADKWNTTVFKKKILEFGKYLFIVVTSAKKENFARADPEFMRNGK